MSQNQFQEIFADCLERMANGNSIDNCIALYPEVAEELRPLLETAQATSRIGIEQSELTAMRQRLDSQIEGLIQDTNFNKRPILRFPNVTLVLVASLVVVFIGIMIYLPNQGGTFGNNPTPTENLLATATPTSITPEVTETVTKVTPENTPFLENEDEETFLDDDDEDDDEDDVEDDDDDLDEDRE